MDGFGLYEAWQQQPSLSLSALLRKYYQGGTQQAVPGFYSRWLTFCRLNGFVTTGNGTISWQLDEEKYNQLIRRVNNMADLVVDGFRGAMATVLTGHTYRTFPYTEYMLNKFLNYFIFFDWYLGHFSNYGKNASHFNSLFLSTSNYLLLATSKYKTCVRLLTRR